MDLQVHPKVLAAPPKNLNTGNTEIAWFWIKDCSDKRGKQIKICDTSEMEALDTKKPHAKFQAGSMALSCNTRLASLNYSEKQQYLLQCAAMENLTIRYRERWKVNDPHQGSRMRPRSRKSTKDWWRDGRDKRGGVRN